MAATNQDPGLGMLGRYELMELLGRGGMAEVYKARLPGALGVDKIVAVKRILPEAVRNPDFVKMFVREARLSARLMHTNLVQVFEFSHAGDELFLAMELVEGCDLRKVLNANKSLGKPLPTELALCVANGVLRGLDYAHRLSDESGRSLKVVHRDLSPANVLLSYEGAVKVADFGVAHADDLEKTDVGKVKGKLQYMAPEQLMSGEIDARVDVFAAGCVLYEMLSGRTAYVGTSTVDLIHQVAHGAVTPLVQLVPDVDPELARMTHRALAARKEDRYATCDQFAGDLARLVQAGRATCAPESELGLYLQVLVPRQPCSPEMLDYTPSPEDLAAPILTGYEVLATGDVMEESKVSFAAPAGLDATDPGFKAIARSIPTASQVPQTSPGMVRPGSAHDVGTSPDMIRPLPAPGTSPGMPRVTVASITPPPEPFPAQPEIDPSQPISLDEATRATGAPDIDEMIKSYLVGQPDSPRAPAEQPRVEVKPRPRIRFPWKR